MTAPKTIKKRVQIITLSSKSGGKDEKIYIVLPQSFKVESIGARDEVELLNQLESASLGSEFDEIDTEEDDDDSPRPTRSEVKIFVDDLAKEHSDRSEPIVLNSQKHKKSKTESQSGPTELEDDIMNFAENSLDEIFPDEDEVIASKDSKKPRDIAELAAMLDEEEDDTLPELEGFGEVDGELPEL